MNSPLIILRKVLKSARLMVFLILLPSAVGAEINDHQTLQTTRALLLDHIDTSADTAEVEAQLESLARETLKQLEQPARLARSSSEANTFANILSYFKEQKSRYGDALTNETLFNTLVQTFKMLIMGNLTWANPAIDPAQHRSTPHVPLVNRTVLGVDERKGFTRPFVPGLRWSADGRIGVSSQGGSPQNTLRIELHRPEQLNTLLEDSASGPHTMDLDVLHFNYSEFAVEHNLHAQHLNLCDAVQADDAKNNPQTCGFNGEDDCYRMTLISSGVGNSEGGLAFGSTIIGTPIEIRVANPKTPQAKIAEVTFGESVTSPNHRMSTLFETLTTLDGHLFVARRGWQPLIWEEAVTGEIRGGAYDTVYAVAPPDAEPCDVTQWTDLKPITHAPYDPAVNQRYLFAKYPFRDPRGTLISNGADIKGTYPWIDKEAKMLVVQVNPARIFNDSLFPSQRYGARCIYNDCILADRDDTHDMTYVMLGGWTKGKMVVLDNLLNSADFRLRLNSGMLLDLYQPGTALGATENVSHEVAIGATRGDGPVPVFDEYQNNIGRYELRNSSIFDSIENRFNGHSNINSPVPKDVVWRVSSGHAMDDLVFDDYLNRHAFIISNMNGSYRWDNNNPGRMTYYDGWNKVTGNFDSQVRIDNSATTLPDTWVVPKDGYVSNGRLEPVANGGVTGKGLWFNGSTHIAYHIPQHQPQNFQTKDWYHSLFIDTRQSPGEESVLLNFPDRSRVTLKDAVLTIYNDKGQSQATINIPESFLFERWLNLGLLKSTSGQVKVYLNGFLFDDVSGLSHVLNLGAGRDMVVGAGVHDFNPIKKIVSFFFRFFSWVLSWFGVELSTPAVSHQGFVGWIDEYKVFSYEPDAESICNFSHGTLVALTEGSAVELRDIADQFPKEYHDAISSQLAARGEATYEKYLCFQDNASENSQAHLKNLPDNTIGLRANIHFPEGPIYHDAPRPDSSTNEFCLSCHEEQAEGGLTIDALRYIPTLNAKDDPRRQPSQPPARVFGNLSPALIDSISGDWGSYGSTYIDEYIQPSVMDAYQRIKGLSLIADDGVIANAILLDGDIVYQCQHQGIRVLVEGAQPAIEFTLAGQTRLLSKPPYDIPLNHLNPGDYRLTLHTIDSDLDPVDLNFKLSGCN